MSEGPGEGEERSRERGRGRTLEQGDDGVVLCVEAVVDLGRVEAVGGLERVGREESGAELGSRRGRHEGHRERCGGLGCLSVCLREVQLV